MSHVFEARYYGDPAQVAEVNELKANAAAARESERAIEQAKLQSRRERMHALVFKKAGER